VSSLVDSAIIFALAVPAIVLHEVSHGYVAYLLGDPTAKARGRLSLNPLRHVDTFGTIILPALLSFTGGPVFGYAKPVPINPAYFKDRRAGMTITGLAGPAMNLALAAVSGVASRILVGFGGTLGFISDLLYFFAYINLILMCFNLIPIPPLDGSRVLPLFLNREGMLIYHKVERYGFLILFMLIFLVPGAIHTYLEYTALPLLHLFAG